MKLLVVGFSFFFSLIVISFEGALQVHPLLFSPVFFSSPFFFSKLVSVLLLLSACHHEEGAAALQYRV